MAEMKRIINVRNIAPLSCTVQRSLQDFIQFNIVHCITS